MKIVSFIAVFLSVSVFADVVPIPGWSDLAPERIVSLGDNVRPVRLGPGRFSMTADFSILQENRACWDFPIQMDMRKRSGIEFDFLCLGSESVSGFNIYLKSGNGWYTGRMELQSKGKWHRVTVKKSAFFRTEGNVAGWGRVDVLRIAAWRCGKGIVTLGIGNLSFPDEEAPLIGVVRPDSCITNPKYRSEKENLVKFLSSTLRAIEEAGVSVSEMSDVELDADVVAGMKLLVFPYNPSVPEKSVRCIKDFVAGGGRLFACHTTDPEVRKVLGLDGKRYSGRDWNSSTEKPTAERNGFYLSHVWRYAPEDSIRQACDLLLRVDPSWKGRIDAALLSAQKRVMEDAAWIASRPSKQGEWRAFWCHSARGLKGQNWDETIRLLKVNGFNAILPNLAWGGTAFYRSKVLPVHSSVATDGDALKDCLAACRKYGVECHVWKICGNMGARADKKIVERFRADNRLQQGADGKERNWLCLSRPENRALEIEAFVELARMGPDGVHFDYIRYPDANHCFCDYCRKCFEKQIGWEVEGWPKTVLKGGNTALAVEWCKFRCGNVTAIVKGVAERVRREAPGVKLSAAVFTDPKGDPQRIGQDWVSWCREGLLDFICPMDYHGNYGAIIASQRKILEGCPVKLRPGIGLSCWEDTRMDAITAAKQIEDVRRVGLDGFVIFDLTKRGAKVLPILHSGPTR